MSRHQRYFREARKTVAAAASSDKMLQLLEQVINSEADSDIVPIMRAFDRGGVAGALKEVKKRLGDEAVYELRRRGFKASASAAVEAAIADTTVRQAVIRARSELDQISNVLDDAAASTEEAGERRQADSIGNAAALVNKAIGELKRALD